MTNPTNMLADSRTTDGEILIDARRRLHLSQRELAELLNTSLYAVVRWERGDLDPTTDVLDRLDELLRTGLTDVRPLSAEVARVFFPSTGIRKQSAFRPLLDTVEIRFLDSPRKRYLDEIYDAPFWGDGYLALADMLRRNRTPAVTRKEALPDAISAGKNTYTYDAHTYHTKVPPQGIASVIASYLPNGGLILDPFGGSGMTAVAARYLGYDVIINELSPAACFIAHNFTRVVDLNDFNSAVAKVVDNLAAVRKLLYSTTCRKCGKEVEQLYTVWSYSLECNHCGIEFVLWDHCRNMVRACASTSCSVCFRVRYAQTRSISQT